MNQLLLEVLYQNTLDCPKCGNKQKVEMLSLESPHYYQCDSCHEVIQSTNGKCCVYCQYGEVKCPIEQVKRN